MAIKKVRIFLLSSMFCTLFITQVSAEPIDLTGDIWDVSGRDINFTWDETDLEFTSQTPKRIGLRPSGVFRLGWFGQ